MAERQVGESLDGSKPQSRPTSVPLVYDSSCSTQVAQLKWPNSSNSSGLDAKKRQSPHLSMGALLRYVSYHRRTKESFSSGS
jgi:hypothetical protein